MAAPTRHLPSWLALTGVVLSLALLLLLGACSPTPVPLMAPGATGVPVVQTVVVPGSASTGVDAHNAGQVQLPAERLIIREGRLVLVVDDTRAARQAVVDLVAESAGEGAFVVEDNESGGVPGRPPAIDMVVRVPAARFDDVMDRLAALAVEVQVREATADDVTAEYVDLEGRVKALEAARDRLRAIMTEAGTTEDLLQAEQQLTSRESEIEGLKGRMQYLSQSAALSKIAISLRPTILSQPVDDSWRIPETARAAFDALVASVRGVVSFLIWFVIAAGPWLLATGAVVWGVLRWRRRRAARKVSA